MQPSSIYIGIDIGTSGIRACAIDDAEALLSQCSQPLPSPERDQQSVTQVVTQDAHLWWQATTQVLRTLFSRIEVSRVRAISVNGTSGSLLPVDSRGQPLAPALMYNHAACVAQAHRISQLAPAESAAHGASSGLAKALYLQEKYPEARYLLHQADWILGCLCGRFGISDENNALKTGYDPLQSRWPQWLDALNLDLQRLPEVVPPGTRIAPLSPGLFEKLPTDCYMVSGTTDSIAAFIATGASQPGDAVTSLGSTLVLKIISRKPVFDAASGIYSHKLGDYWLAGGASNTGGAVIDHYFSPAQIDALTPRLQPDHPSGLDYYPLLQPGERFPICDPRLAPRLEPRADSDVEFFQGILEGIAHIEQRGYRKLQQLGAAYPHQVETAGGGSRNPAWTQIRQRLLGVTVRQAAFSEACYGSALLAKRGYNQ